MAQNQPQKQIPLSDILNLTKFIRDNKLDNDARIGALLTCIVADPADVESYENLMLLLQPKLVGIQLHPDPFRPNPEQDEVAGPIALGLCNETSALFGLFPDELMQGLLIAGRPGAGKTTLCYRIIEECNKQGIHCLMLDLKQDYRHLIRNLKNTMVFRCCEDDTSYLFKWNPLDPPGKPEDWIPVFSDVTAEAYSFFDGTSSYLQSHLYELYRNSSPNIPTLLELQKKIEQEKHALITRDARYKESALNRLRTLTARLEKTLDYRKGYNISEILTRNNVVIEIDNLGRTARIYLTTLILAHIFQNRILSRRDSSPVIVIIDEANEIFNREIERQKGDLTISQLAREVREFKLGIIASCQLPEAICRSIKNCFTRVLMSLTEGKNLEDMSASLGLEKEQREIVWQLLTGQAIIRTARYPKPFAVAFPNYSIKKDVSEEELENHMGSFIPELSFSQAEHKKPEPEKATENETKTETQTKTKKEPGKEREKKKEKAEPEIPQDEKEFLMDLYLKPYLSITQHYENLNLSAGKGHRIVKALARKQLCNIQEINLGGRGGLTKFLVLTEQGYEAIGMKEKKHISRGAGFEHEFWQFKLTEALKNQGYKAEIEKNLNNKFLDIGVETEKGIIAIEIAITSEHEKENITKDINAGCALVIITCKDGKIRQEALKIAQEHEFSDKTRVYLASDLLRADFKVILNPEYSE